MNTLADDSRARELVKTIAGAANELLSLFADGLSESSSRDRFEELDRARRRRPEWKRRGRVFYAIDQAGGRVSDLEFIMIMLNAGYKDMRGSSGFFRGAPIPVLEQDGHEILLTERG